MGGCGQKWGLKDRGTRKPGISHKWFDALIRLIEWSLHADSDGIIWPQNLLILSLVFAGNILK